MTAVPAAIRAAFDQATSILFVTGAGVSAESGLPTYRGVGGLYDGATEDGLAIEDVLSGSTFRRDPTLVWKYLAQVEQASRGAEPNAAHRAIAALEKRARVTVLTQNVDGLHLDAGSTDVIEIHGTVRRRRCPSCRRIEPSDHWSSDDLLPRCVCGAVVRPDAVLFGETLPMAATNRMRAALDQGFDLVVSVGTTSVFPYISAPVLRQVALGRAAIEINLGETAVSSAVALRWAERAGVALDAVVDQG